MKQKRKVKSLIPQKNDLGESLLTAALLVLGVALCLGSATLMTSSVGAASTSNEYDQFQYSGTDDKVEVLYNLQFSDPKILSGFVGEMYTDKNNDFYITSTPITVNDSGVKAEDINEVDKGLYSNIFGGHKNKVHSDYVTIIGGEENVVAALNTNAVIFGGKQNEISGGTAGNPSVIIGGEKNLIKGGHNGDAIIGGNNDTISGSVSNSFILGGIRNNIASDKGISNVIVGGSNNVTVDTGDVFVFSDSSFKPLSPKTFYLNVSNGLGINVQSAGKGVTVNGPVRFGEIDITKPEYPCDSNNYGVIGSWNGCLVGCTPTTAQDGGRWDMLDRGERCQKLCDDEDRCSNKMPEIKDPDAYSGFCTNGVNTGNASPCTPVWDEVKNVVFETALINSEQYGGKCPGSDAINKCIYQCNSGYYLTGDNTYSTNVNGGQTACYGVCDLYNDLGPEWVNEDGSHIILKHNQMVTGYNVNDTTCARDNPYTNKDNGTAGEAFPEHCGNNQHKKPLVCVNGHMEIANGYTNPRSSSNNAKAKGYTHRDCAVHQFRCDTSAGKFDLNRNYIISTLLDNPIKTDQATDRKQMVGTRGTYKLCLDYDVLNSPANEKAPGNEVCNIHLGNNKPYVEHYQFVGCNENQGYHRSTRDGETDKYICRKECTIDTNEGKKTVWDNMSITLYKGPKELCENNKGEAGKYICKEHTFTCDDGEWKTEDRPYVGQYTYTTCTQEGVACGSPYNVPADKRANFDVTYYSAPCHRWYAYPSTITKTYKTNGNAQYGYAKNGYTTIQDPCIDGGDHYQLLGCQDCHHATSQYYCDKELNAEFISFCSTSEAGKVAKGYNYKYWSSTSWYGGKMENKGNCDYYCDYDNDYYDCGSSCCKNKTLSEIQKSCDDRPEDGTGIRVELDTKVEGNADWFRYEVYSTTGSNSGSRIDYTDWCFDGCKSTDSRGRELRRAGTDCELKYQTYDCVGTLPEHASVVGSDSHYGTIPEEYDWNPSGGDCAFKCDYGYEWDEVSHACLYIGWNCGAKCSYNVTFDPNGGTIKGTAPDNVECGGTIHMPNVERSCYKFLGWNDGNNKYAIGAPYQVNSFVGFTAEWERDTSKPECKYDCLAPEPRFDATTMERSDKKPEWDGEHWSRVTHNGDLTACQWRCKLEYKVTSDGLGCEKKPCQENSAGNDPWLNPPTSIEGVIKGPETYVGTDTRRWKRITSGEPVECQWRCDTEHYYEFDSLTRTCVKRVPAGCAPDATNPKHYQCTEGSTPTGTGTITNGWKWNCEGKDKVTCLECELGYKKNTTSNTCDPYKCKTPVPSGEGVNVGPTTFTGVGVVDNKEWSYTGAKLSDLKACEWSCKKNYIRSGNTCVKEIDSLCGNPETHYDCGTDNEVINSGDIKVGSKHAGWEWRCKGTIGDPVKCVECEDGFQKTGEGEDKTCVGEGDVNGECDFSKANTPACKSGELAIQTDESDAEGGTTVWNCKGKGTGKTAICGVRAYCGGTCKANKSGIASSVCYNLEWNFSTNYDSSDISQCKNAAGYYSSTDHGLGRCYLGKNVFGGMGLNSCESYRLQGYGYVSCFEWENGSAVCEVLNDKGEWTKTSADKCNPIKDKVPSECSFETVNVEPEVECENGWEIIWTNNPSCGNAPWWAEQYDATQEGWRYRYGHKSQEVCMDRGKMAGGLETVPGNPNIPCFTCSCTNNEGEAPKKIQVTVIIPNSTPQCSYSNFLLIRRDYGGHVSPNGNYSWQQSNNGETHAVTFEVSHDWINKAVTMQLDKTCNYGYVGSSSVGGGGSDWIIPDHDVSFTYTDPAGV